MAAAATAVHHAWVKDFTDGAIDPEKHVGGGAKQAASPAGGGKKVPPNIQLAVFSDHAGTRKTMELCDTIHRSKAVQVNIGGTAYKVEEVFAPVIQCVTKAANSIEAMNHESRTQAYDHLKDEHGFQLIAAKWAGVSAEKTYAEVGKLTVESGKYLNDARHAIGMNEFALAYGYLLLGINSGFAARDACLYFGEHMIKGGEDVVSKLEIARNGTFAAVGVLSGVAEVGIVVEAGIALLPVAAEALGKILMDEKVNWGNFGAEVLLTLVLSKFKVPFGAAMEGACKPVVLKLLPKAIGKITLTPAQEEAVIKWVAEAVIEKGKAGLVAIATAVCKEKEKKPQTYKEIAMDYIKEATSREAIAKFVQETLLTQALAKAGVKLATPGKTAA